MKVYFAKKPNHRNINSVYYPKNLLDEAVERLNSFKSTKFITFDKSMISELQNVVAMFDKLEYDDDREMYFANIRFPKHMEAFKDCFHNAFIDCITMVDQVKTLNCDLSITAISFVNCFYVLSQSETNIQGDFNERDNLSDL